MISSVLQAVISVLALASVFVAGYKHVSAWVLLILAHGLSMGYFIWTSQWLLIPLSAGMVAVGFRNFLLWHYESQLMKKRE